MRKVNFLKISFKCGVLSSNLLNFNAMENIINLKSNIETNNIYDKEEKEKIEILEQLKNEYLDEIVYRIIKRANRKNLEKYKNPDEYLNSEEIKDNFNKLKEKVLLEIYKKKDNENKNEIKIDNEKYYKKEDLKDLISKLNYNHVDIITKYIKEIYMFHICEYDSEILLKNCNISKDKYKYFNKFVLTVEAPKCAEIMNKNYYRKVYFKEIGENKNSKLKKFIIIADKNYINGLFYLSDIENVLKIRNYVDKNGEVDLSFFFSHCHTLKNINFDGFYTENVINMQYMFEHCYCLENIDLSCFKTDRVINMSGMFNNCRKIKDLDLKSFNTEKVKNFEDMFFCCNSLENLNIENFNTKNAENCSLMFSDCHKLKSLNLKNFNISNIKNAGYMFEGCSNLEKVIIGEKETKTEKSSDLCDEKEELVLCRMFANCINLKDLEIHISNNVKIKTYNMFYNTKKLLLKNIITENNDLHLYINKKINKKIYKNHINNPYNKKK